MKRLSTLLLLMLSASAFAADEPDGFVLWSAKDLALHTTYWHDKLGTPRSHGCINLAPADARFLYFWSTPNVPVGWNTPVASTVPASAWYFLSAVGLAMPNIGRPMAARNELDGRLRISDTLY